MPYQDWPSAFGRVQLECHHLFEVQSTTQRARQISRFSPLTICPIYADSQHAKWPIKGLILDGVIALGDKYHAVATDDDYRNGSRRVFLHNVTTSIWFSLLSRLYFKQVVAFQLYPSKCTWPILIWHRSLDKIEELIGRIFVLSVILT